VFYPKSKCNSAVATWVCSLPNQKDQQGIPSAEQWCLTKTVQLHISSLPKAREGSLLFGSLVNKKEMEFPIINEGRTLAQHDGCVAEELVEKAEALPSG
jgi:hypothetical protein